VSWGPWSPGIFDDVERRCQLRSLAALTAIFFGSGHMLVAELRDAERGYVYASQRALDLINCLPTRSRRKMLSVFGAITWPRPQRGWR
jgi:hypothetical protein